MISPSEKKVLWQSMQSEHPELARALQACKKAGNDNVAIDKYPEKTNQWVWASIQTQNQPLAELLERMREDVAALEDFDPSIEIAVDDLVSALVGAGATNDTVYKQASVA